MAADAFQEWSCNKHQLRAMKPPADFECDACGLMYSSPPPGSFAISLFRENCLQCEACGLFVHEKCQGTVLSPSLCLFAKTRVRERKSRLVFATLILPELKTQHALLLQRSKVLDAELKTLTSALDESTWNRGWALKTFANQFYSDHNPEKLLGPNFISSLVQIYGKNPAKFRAFFTKLVSTYPDSKQEILAQLDQFEQEMLQQHDLQIAEFESKESQLEKIDSDRDELFREIHFPMASILNSPHRLRFSVQDYVVVAIGDFFLEKIQCKLAVTCGYREEVGSFVQVEISGFDSNIASIVASLDRFSLFGTTLPISTYSANSMGVSFEFSLRIRCEFSPGRRWLVNKDETVIEISNFKHHLQGASFPLPTSLLNLIVNSVFASQVKRALLELLPIELGDLLQRAKKPTAVDLEFRIQSETLISKRFLHESFAAMTTQLVPGVEPSHLHQVCIALSPRQTKTEDWNLSKLLAQYTRFFWDKADWVGIWRLYGFPQCEDLFAYLKHIDNKPLSLQLECTQLKLEFQAKQVLRTARDVLIRLSASGGGGSSGGNVDLRNQPTDHRQRKKPASSSTSSSSTREVMTELCNSGEQLVHSVLSHAIKELSFSLRFSNGAQECELLVCPFSMTSQASHDFSSSTTDMLTQMMTIAAPPLPPKSWSQTFGMNQDTGVIELCLNKQESAFALFFSLSECALRLVCDAPAFVVFKMGFKQGNTLETRGEPRIETTFERLRLVGTFASYFRLARDVRLAALHETGIKPSRVDEIDSFLARMEHKVEENLTFDLNLDFQAFAVENNDINVRVCLNECAYQDEIELITMFSDLQAFVFS